MKTIKQEKPAQGVVVPKKNEKKEFPYLRNSEKAAAKKALAGKKAQGGGPVKDTTKVSYETSPFTKIKQEKEDKKTEYKKFTKTMKKAQGGTKFAALAPPYDKATYADKIAGAKKNAGTAKSGTKIKKAMMGKTMMKSGGKMKTCKGGC
jgi:hypothetical protein